MNAFRVFPIAILFLQVLVSESYAEDSATPVGANDPDGRFLVFDGTLYQSKPDLARHGVLPVHIIYAGDFWDPNADRDLLPEQSRVINLAERAQSADSLTVIDIEHWPTRSRDGAVEESIAKYREVLRMFRSAEPQLRLGYYGVPPIRDYWRAIEGQQSNAYAEWQIENDKLRILAQDVDVLFPSIYTFYEDREGWKNYAIAQIAEARRYATGKPVYAFIWPEYHGSNKLLGGTNIEAEYWALQLETLRQHADGIVIWGGWQQEWDEDAPWWRETKSFVSKIGE